ncbi:unnamed protein product, partial [Rotaria sp. Silwood1]
MHTVFRVDDITPSEKHKRLWQVELTHTDDSDPQLAALTKRIKEEIDGKRWYRISKLMLQVGDLDQAEELYNKLLKNADDDRDTTHIHHQLGVLQQRLGRYKEAVTSYEKSIEIQRKTVSDDHSTLAPT